MTSNASGGDAAGGYLGFLRAVARIAVLAGAVGSVGLLLRAGRSTPRLLLVLFVVWVLSPFGVLACADLVSKRWAVLTRATIYWVTLAVALGSLAIYWKLGLRPSGSPRTPVFVAVPPASWLLIAIVVPIAAVLARRRSQRSAAA